LSRGEGGDGHDDGEAYDSCDDSAGAHSKSARSSAGPSSNETIALHDFLHPFGHCNQRAKELIEASRGEWSFSACESSLTCKPEGEQQQRQLYDMQSAQPPGAAVAVATAVCEDGNQLRLRLDHLRSGNSPSTNLGARLHPELSRSINREGRVCSSGPLRSAGIQGSRGVTREGPQSTCWLGLGIHIDENGNFVS